MSDGSVAKKQRPQSGTHSSSVLNLRDLGHSHPTAQPESVEMQLFYQRLSEHIRQCYWLLDISTQKVSMVSENFERVWDQSRSILNDGMTGFMECVLPEDRDHVLSDFHIAIASGPHLNTEFRVMNEKGEQRWLWMRGLPLVAAANSITPLDMNPNGQKIVLMADDITERKLQQQFLREQEAQLISRAKTIAVGDLASGVAHEINNPLTVIVGKAAELKRLADSASLNANTVIEIADKIQTTSIRISKIITSLKSLSSPNKSIALQKTPFAKIFHDLADICSERFRANEVTLDIPEFPANLWSEMNPTLISQLLLNLINNAFDAVQEQSRKWVRVEYLADEASVFIYVTDSGPGIPIKNRGRIFDPFFTTKGPGKGTGLGLSLASSIAAHHNGTIRLDNLYVFTRFVIQLPKQQPK